MIDSLKNAKLRQQAYKKFFLTDEGKIVLKDLFNACKVNRSIITDNARKDAFNEGRRSVYVYIVNLIGQDLEKLIEETTGGLDNG